MAAMSICSSTSSFNLPSPPIPMLTGAGNLWTCCSIQLYPSKILVLFRSHNRKLRSLGPDRGRRFGISCKATPITEVEFPETVLKSEVLVLVEFVANWCGPCRLIVPVVDWVAQEYEGRLKVMKIDHDSNPKLIEEYKVYGLPTLILFKNGKEVPDSRSEGAMTTVKLKEYVDTLLESVTTA